MVRDVSDPAHGQTICTFSTYLESARFVSATKIGYANNDAVYVADLQTGTSALVALVPAYLLGFAMTWSPDGTSFSYLTEGGSAGPEWHLVVNGQDHVLTTLPLTKFVDTLPDYDDVYLSFSADGTYLALVERLAIGANADQDAEVEVRDRSGQLLFSLHNVTMATWSQRYLYFFDDGFGLVRFWQPGQPQLGGVGISSQWIRPASSPDGRYIVYTTQLDKGVHHIRLFDLSAPLDYQISLAGIGAMFLSQSLVWYTEESPCSSACSLGGPPVTGRTFIYDVTSKTVSASVITYLYDTWPHLGVGRTNHA